MSIGVSVRTTKFVAHNNVGGVGQESNPQFHTAGTSNRYRREKNKTEKRIICYLIENSN